MFSIFSSSGMEIILARNNFYWQSRNKDPIYWVFRKVSSMNLSFLQSFMQSCRPYNHSVFTILDFHSLTDPHLPVKFLIQYLSEHMFAISEQSRRFY